MKIEESLCRTVERYQARLVGWQSDRVPLKDGLKSPLWGVLTLLGLHRLRAARSKLAIASFSNLRRFSPHSHCQ